MRIFPQVMLELRPGTLGPIMTRKIGAQKRLIILSDRRPPFHHPLNLNSSRAAVQSLLQNKVDGIAHGASGMEKNRGPAVLILSELDASTMLFMCEDVGKRREERKMDRK